MRNANNAISARPTTAAAIPIPAFAPVLKVLEDEDSDEGVAEVVLAAAEEAVTLATEDDEEAGVELAVEVLPAMVARSDGSGA